jgi:DNA-binding transcriptional ArsR family regulator
MSDAGRDGAETGDDGTAPPPDVFATLGDETRMAILRELFEAESGGDREDPIPFARLREQVGVEDSGRFNYHLGKLEGQFLEKTEDGYRLDYAGRKVVAAVYAGTYTGDHAATGEYPCPVCDDPATVTYEDGRLRTECPNDHRVGAEYPPGAAADYPLDRLVPAALLVTRQDVELGAEGVCSQYYGSLGEFSPVERSVPFGDGSDGSEVVLLERSCRRCSATYSYTPGIAAFRHPEVIAFHYERGVDLLSEGILEREWTAPGSATVRSEEPYQFEVVVAIDDDRLEVVVDDDGEVVRTERD